LDSNETIWRAKKSHTKDNRTRLPNKGARNRSGVLEAHNFERDLTKYQSQNAIVLGVSADTVKSHKDFCTKEGLNLKLLADPELKTISRYGSARENNGAKMAARNTFLIDPDGKIARVYISVKPAGHSEKILNDLAVLAKK